jgi:hypothetical protein
MRTSKDKRGGSKIGGKQRNVSNVQNGNTTTRAQISPSTISSEVKAVESSATTEWRRSFSKKQNRPFWINTKTNTISWQNPSRSIAESPSSVTPSNLTPQHSEGLEIETKTVSSLNTKEQEQSIVPGNSTVKSPSEKDTSQPATDTDPSKPASIPSSSSIAKRSSSSFMSDESDRLRKTEYLAKLKMTVAFISYHQAGVGGWGVLFHDKICETLDLDSSLVFLDTNCLSNLSELLQHVRKTGVLISLLTKDTLTRPFVLAELNEAILNCIPIVPVVLTGYGYDFDEASEFLGSNDFRNVLESKNPGAAKALEAQGMDVAKVGETLTKKFVPLIARKFDQTINEHGRVAFFHDLTRQIVDCVVTPQAISRAENILELVELFRSLDADISEEELFAYAAMFAKNGFRTSTLPILAKPKDLETCGVTKLAHRRAITQILKETWDERERVMSLDAHGRNMLRMKHASLEIDQQNRKSLELTDDAKYCLDHSGAPPLPLGSVVKSSKPLPRSAASALLENHADKKKFNSADWAKDLTKPKDKKG